MNLFSNPNSICYTIYHNHSFRNLDPGQLEEHSLEAGVPALGAGHQRDEQDVLGGEEGQVVGGRVGPTQPAGQKGECYGSHRTSAEGSRVGSPHRGVRPHPRPAI